MDDKIIFRKQWADAIKILPDEIRLEVYDAFVNYAFSGDESVSLSPAAMIAFTFIKNDIESERRRQLSISEKRKAAGSKGGFYKSNRNAARRKDAEEIPMLEAVLDAPPEAPPEEPVSGAVVETDLFGNEITHEPEKKPPTAKKPPQKRKYAPLVLLTEAEYEKLASQYGDDGAQWMITKLDNYKAARGMTYKSDYRAILNWVVKEFEKEQLKHNSYGTNETWRPTAKEQRDAEFASYIAEKLSGG